MNRNLQTEAQGGAARGRAVGHRVTQALGPQRGRAASRSMSEMACLRALVSWQQTANMAT